jgi:hypothetical protein
VVAVGEKANLLRQPRLPGVEVLGYELPELKNVDPFNGAVVKAIHRGKRVAAGAAHLKRQGFRPDVIFAHIGWGEALFLKDIFPEARILLYCEFFYGSREARRRLRPGIPAQRREDPAPARDERAAPHVARRDATGAWRRRAGSRSSFRQRTRAHERHPRRHRHRFGLPSKGF